MRRRVVVPVIAYFIMLFCVYALKTVWFAKMNVYVVRAVAARRESLLPVLYPLAHFASSVARQQHEILAIGFVSG
jgi:hypothetical protein